MYNSLGMQKTITRKDKGGSKLDSRKITPSLNQQQGPKTTSTLVGRTHICTRENMQNYNMTIKPMGTH